MGQPRRRALGLLGLLLALREAAVTIGELAAIRAIVAVHAQHNRPKLLAALDAELERERAQSTEEEGYDGDTNRNDPQGGAGNAENPRGPRHQRTS